MTATIGYDVADRTAKILIDNPGQRNAFTGEMREELAFALDRAQQDPTVRVIAIRGAGGFFSAGGDLDYLGELAERGEPDGLERLLEAGARIVKTIRKLEKPVVAVVEGVAAGAGCSLAAAADLVIAARGARFLVPFSRIGLVPDWGGTFFLPRRVGAARALRLATSAEPIDADTAFAWGLVDVVVDDVDATVTTELARLADLSPTSFSFQKYLISSEEMPALEEALAREAEAQLACFETLEFRTAMSARRAAKG